MTNVTNQRLTQAIRCRYARLARRSTAITFLKAEAR